MTKRKKTITISPKVYVPTATSIIVGTILLAFGERDYGVGILLAAVINGGLGYMAKHK